MPDHGKRACLRVAGVTRSGTSKRGASRCRADIVEAVRTGSSSTWSTSSTSRPCPGHTVMTGTPPTTPRPCWACCCTPTASACAPAGRSNDAAPRTSPPGCLPPTSPRPRHDRPLPRPPPDRAARLPGRLAEAARRRRDGPGRHRRAGRHQLAAHAADKANRTHNKLDAEVVEILRQAAEVDRDEDRRLGDAMGRAAPALASRAGRLDRLRQPRPSCRPRPPGGSGPTSSGGRQAESPGRSSVGRRRRLTRASARRHRNRSNSLRQGVTLPRHSAVLPDRRQPAQGGSGMRVSDTTSPGGSQCSRCEQEPGSP